jgi:putative endonuclease
MKYYVYILFSQTRKRYYVGQTQNFEKRLKRHNKGLVLSTKGGKSWELVKRFEIESRSEAMKLEHKIKKRGIERFLKDNHFGV